MKKSERRITVITVLLFTVLSVSLTCCSSDNDNEVDENRSKIENSYNNVKSKIVGTWVMDAYHSTSRITNPYTSLGWDEEVWAWVNSEVYKYTFTSDGKVTDNKNNTYNYTISVDYDKVAYYNITNDALNIHYPYSKGVVKLALSDKYNTVYFIEIQSNGKLYLYNTVMSTGGEGVGKYRYKKE